MNMLSSEKEKMLNGAPYSPLDEVLVAERLLARQRIKKLSLIDPSEEKEIALLLKDLLPNAAKDIRIELPFHCDYGYNIFTGKRVFINFDCVILDVNSVTIGNHVLIGPGVHIYTATHPLPSKERRHSCFAKPVRIGDDCWIGGHSVICPGVEIGPGTVIGAGSVVTRSLPENVFAAGNPARIIRAIT
jgi:maltose O-acetyltransferase